MAVDPRAFLTILLLLFILFSPNSGPDPLQRTPSRYAAARNASRANLLALNTTHYSDFDPTQDKWINITGCTFESEFAWTALPAVKERARQLSAYALGSENTGLFDGEGIEEVQIPLYRNVTGVSFGDWIRSPLQKGIGLPKLNLSDFAAEGPFGPLPLRSFGRNLTGDTGQLKVWLEESEEVGVRKEDVKVREIRAQVTVQDDESSGDGWEARMFGVHFLGSGNVVLATTSNRYVNLWIWVMSRW